MYRYKYLQFYKDKDLTQEIESEILDLGTTPAGETKQYKFWIANEANSHVKDLKFLFEHNEVKIIKAPLELLAYANDELIIEYSPNVTLEKGIDKLPITIKGTVIWS